MRKLLSIGIALLLGFSPRLLAQIPSPQGYGDITASSSSAACATANSCVELTIPPAAGGTSIQVSGTFVGTLNFETTLDSANWTAITGTPVSAGSAVSTATSTGIWQFNTSGLQKIHVRASSYTSGTAHIVIQSGAEGPATGVNTVVGLPGITYNATQPTFTDQQAATDVQITSRGAVIVNPGVESFPIGATNPQGSAASLTNLGGALVVTGNVQVTTNPLNRLRLPCNALRTTNCN